VYEFNNAADFYLNGSDIDNMPGSIIEAFAAGLPVVTTDAGASLTSSAQNEPVFWFHAVTTSRWLEE